MQTYLMLKHGNFYANKTGYRVVKKFLSVIDKGPVIMQHRVNNVNAIQCRMQ